MTPTPIHQAIDEILKSVYEKDAFGGDVFNSVVDEIEIKYQVYNKLAERLKSEDLIIIISNSPIVKITKHGREIQEQGGYIAMLQEQERIQKREEYLKELEISDKLGSIEDRKKNRRLAWIAIGISVASAIWTAISDVFLDN